jgi:CheY-like chemotaxis protein
MGPSAFYSLTTVSNLAVLKANRDVDMVVVDINMPRMDGLSLLQKLARNGVPTQFHRWYAGAGAPAAPHPSHLVRRETKAGTWIAIGR